MTHDAPYVSVNRCGTHWEQTLWYPRSCVIACTVQMLAFKSVHRAWKIWCQSLPTAFFNHVKFSGLATVWTCPHFDKSAAHCLPISNRHSQSTTVVFDMHVHHRQHTSTYEFHQVVILPLWETKSPPSGFVWTDSTPGTPSWRGNIVSSVL